MKSTFSLPASAGISLKPEHFQDALQSQIEGLWFEVHAENYLMDGGPRFQALKNIAAKYPISVHGVGASLAGPKGVDTQHINRIKKLCDTLSIASFSEHLAWSTANKHYYSNLLPIPLTKETLASVTANIDKVQDILERNIAIENPANYISLKSNIFEADFLMELSHKTDCSLLLDVNNLYISANNVGLDPIEYIDVLDLSVVGEIHIAGHMTDPNHADLLIDSHDRVVSDGVWSLLNTVLSQKGASAVLVERDANLPSFDVLTAERNIANKAINYWSKSK